MAIVDTLNCHLIREPQTGYWILPYGDANTFCVALEDELVVYKRVCLGHNLYSVVRESICLEDVLYLAQLSANAGEG